MFKNKRNEINVHVYLVKKLKISLKRNKTTIIIFVRLYINFLR